MIGQAQWGVSCHIVWENDLKSYNNYEKVAAMLGELPQYLVCQHHSIVSLLLLVGNCQSAIGKC